MLTPQEIILTTLHAQNNCKSKKIEKREKEGEMDVTESQAST